MKELEKLAESAREQLDLKYDADSVKFIEGFIERNKGNFEKEESKGLIKFFRFICRTMYHRKLWRAMATWQ